MTALAGWVPRPLPQRIALEGRYCRLEPVDPVRHGDQLFAASMAEGAEARHRYLFEAPIDRAAFQTWLEGRAASEDPRLFVVIDTATGRVEGRQCLMRIEPAHGAIEIGSILWGPAIARSRVATEALYLFAAYAFDALGYRRFEWKCNDANMPSKRAALRFGFTFEGVFRHHMVVKGENRDTAWFAMIDADWPGIKAGYEAWLEPANFDAAGRQRRGLADMRRDLFAALPRTLPAFTLRRAGADDLAALLTLQRAAYAWNRAVLGVEPLPLMADYAEIIATRECWLAERAGALAGALILEPEGDALLIWSVAAAPAAQNARVGRGLMAFAEQRAREQGFSAMTLYTGEKLVKNVEWYARLGYVTTRIEDVAGRRVVFMRKALPA